MNAKSAVTVKYWLSDEWMQSQFLTTGKMPDKRQVSDVEMSTATQDQREQVFRVAGTEMKIDFDYADRPHFAGTPTAETLSTACKQFADKQDQDLVKKVNSGIQEALESLVRHIDRKDPNLSSYAKITKDQRENAEKYSISLEEYDSKFALYEKNIPVWEAEKFARFAQEKAERERTEKLAEAEKEAKIAEKRTWIAMHGSTYLKRACIQHDYDCQKRYVIERAAIEAPGYAVDWHDGAKWTSRSCPSEKALNALDAALQLGVGDAQIVWLKSPAEPEKNDDEFDNDDEFQACEAIAISGYLGKYDLVKEI